MNFRSFFYNQFNKISMVLCLSAMLGSNLLRSQTGNIHVPSWPQFRGANCSGVNADQNPPIDFGPDRNMKWKTSIPPGNSSPCIWGDFIFLTGYENAGKKLFVLAIQRSNGSLLWQKELVLEKPEKCHPASSPANPTPTTDGDHLYVYAPSLGVVCFSFSGEQKWLLPLASAAVIYGSGSSPILYQGVLYISIDGEKYNRLIAVDGRSGTILWQRHMPPGREDYKSSYSTPVRCGEELVIHRANQVQAYRLKDGSPTWQVKILSNGTSTAVFDDELIYVAAWSNRGETDQKTPIPEYPELIRLYDRDGDGAISRPEIPEDMMYFKRSATDSTLEVMGSVKKIFKYISTDQDSVLQPAEWNEFLKELALVDGEHGLIAIRPGGTGDVTSTHVVWKEKEQLPEVPSPLVYKNHVYMVRENGMLSCLDAQTGRIIYREKLGTRGTIYASPVLADGRIYIETQKGVCVVIKAGDDFQVLARNDLAEPISATPAIVNDTIYIRTAQNLYAFAKQ